MKFKRKNNKYYKVIIMWPSMLKHVVGVIVPSILQDNALKREF